MPLDRPLHVCHCFAPVRGTLAYHHFVVTYVTVDDIRVAYTRETSAGTQLTNEPDEDADSAAQWSLPSDAAAAWALQRSHGYNGTADSLPDWPRKEARA